MKIGIIGTGHLGRIHIKCLVEEGYADQMWIYDTDPDRMAEMAAEFGVRAAEDIDNVLEDTDCVFLVSPTTSHYDWASRLIARGIHLFVEKPVTQNSTQARELQSQLQSSQSILQVGHIERFNPAFVAFEEHGLRPKFIECHRLATYNARGTDVSVVMDLMIHDLDILYHLVDSEVVEIRATGVPLISATADICNARLAFANGAVANVTASRVSLKQMRKMRFFQPDAYATVDFASKELQVFKMKDAVEGDDFVLSTHIGPKAVAVHMPEIPPTNAIKEEQKSFFDAIKTGRSPLVTLEDGARAVILAEQITEQMILESKNW